MKLTPHTDESERACAGFCGKRYAASLPVELSVYLVLIGVTDVRGSSCGFREEAKFFRDEQKFPSSSPQRLVKLYGATNPTGCGFVFYQWTVYVLSSKGINPRFIIDATPSRSIYCRAPTEIIFPESRTGVQSLRSDFRYHSDLWKPLLLRAKAKSDNNRSCGSLSLQRDKTLKRSYLQRRGRINSELSGGFRTRAD